MEEGHLLSIEQYANLYERRKILELESKRKDNLECCVVLNHSQELESHNVVDNDPEKDPLEITITEDSDAIESSSVSSHYPSSVDLLPASLSVQAFNQVFLPAQVTDDQLPGLDKSGVLGVIAEIVESIIPPFGRTDVDGSCSVSSTTLLDFKCDTSSPLVSGSTEENAA